ncbi:MULTISPECIES: hypothetical protein [unclassified Mycobacterium]|uniref:hypothetical protein n=1 Tax=unclassified Mycobacterium TaxID=2642494 RepID=UPI00274049B8|nr:MULTISPECIES: hypothetical protein [unclassified Mycobacterium]MDP7702695.1 hypothetical protein [Mycobacterium sp. TY815]MDP7721187.1 hypothetical protein [Mycobacterium sp. TY814]
MATQTVSLKRVGSVALNDLIGMCAESGDGVPYPLWRTEREPYWGELEQATVPFTARMDADFRHLRQWAETYKEADIWVECRLKPFAPAIPPVRLVAHRAGEAGFVAVQRPTAEVVDVYSLSPLDIGAATAGLTGLTQPGRRSAICIPGFLANFGDRDLGWAGGSEDESYADVNIRERPNVRSTTTISDFDDVTLMATVQSRAEPSAVRGVDWARGVVVLVRITGDGDYVYTPDRSRAVPVTAQSLRARIDDLIAADVAILRRRRGLT